MNYNDTITAILLDCLVDVWEDESNAGRLRLVKQVKLYYLYALCTDDRELFVKFLSEVA